MKLNNRAIIHKTLNLNELSLDNIDKYEKIHNDSFKDMPNASMVSKRELQEYINLSDDTKHYFIVSNDENIDIGIL